MRYLHLFLSWPPFRPTAAASGTERGLASHPSAEGSFSANAPACSDGYQAFLSEESLHFDGLNKDRLSNTAAVGENETRKKSICDSVLGFNHRVVYATR